jgi:hypothetical protein
MVRALSRVSQRNTGSRGDWSRGWSNAWSGGATEAMGSPTEKTNEPLTRWPSTVDTLLQATV